MPPSKTPPPFIHWAPSAPAKPGLPAATDIVGTWYMIASSSTFWQDKKHSVNCSYNHSPTTFVPEMLENHTSYFNDTSNKPSTIKGYDSPSTTEPGIYDWRGAGWLRMVTSRWEVLGYGVLPGPGGDDNENENGEDQDENDSDEKKKKKNKDKKKREPVLVTLAQKTMFSPASLSIYCQTQHGAVTEQDVKFVAKAMKELGDPGLEYEAERFKFIPQNK